MNDNNSRQNANSNSLKLRIDAAGMLHWNGHFFPCAIGKNGVSHAKIEGDGATPGGNFSLRRMLYRPDRLAPPHTALPVAPLTPCDSWCTDPSHALYNQQVRQPIQASCVLLWRTDLIFDVIVILGHNDSPVLPGIGSAIFMHVAAKDLKPTKGSIALCKQDLLTVLRGCDTCAQLYVDALDAALQNGACGLASTSDHTIRNTSLMPSH